METVKRLPVYMAAVLLSGMVGCTQKEASIAYDVDLSRYEQPDASENFKTVQYNNTLHDINQDLVFVCGKKDNYVPPEGINSRDKIAKNILILNGLVDENKKQIAYLSSEVKKYKKGNSELYLALKDNKRKLQDYENQLEAFRQELLVKDFTDDELNMTIDNLIIESELLRIQADKYRTDLSTGYYVCQNKRALKRQGLLVEKGGVLGIGQTTVLNAEAANENNFTSIDIHKVRDIAIHGEKPELVTNHPEGSYEFQRKNNMVTYLHIENPEKFWRSSKYMVVAVR